MPHVSKEQLEEKIFLRIYKQFTDSVSSQSHKKQSVLSDLLTKTEKVMFAKRLSVIFMLLEGASFYNIKEVLNVSTSTSFRLRNDIDKGVYSNIENLLRTKQKKKDFWEALEVIVRAGMPPMGRGRWKWLYEMDSKYK